MSNVTAFCTIHYPRHLLLPIRNRKAGPGWISCFRIRPFYTTNLQYNDSLISEYPVKKYRPALLLLVFLLYSRWSMYGKSRFIPLRSLLTFCHAWLYIDSHVRTIRHQRRQGTKTQMYSSLNYKESTHRTRWWRMGVDYCACHLTLGLSYWKRERWRTRTN